MTYGTGGAGFMGLAFEGTPGVYTAPTKFAPFLTESLKFTQNNTLRRAIRQSVDPTGVIPGDSNIAGDITMEAFEEVVPYFLYAARVATPVKAGSGNYTYTFLGNAAAVSYRTLSLTVVRNGVVFGYTGCSVASFTFEIANGTLNFHPTIIGYDESVQSLPTAVFPTTEIPYGSGAYSLQIPTATQIFDADKFTMSVEDSGNAQFRLKNTGRAASFVSFGERSVKATVERDFQDRTDYDGFKAVTAQAITLLASKGVNNSIQLDIPVGIKSDYSVNIGGQGDLIRGQVNYDGVVDSTGKAYQVTVKAQENIT